MGAFKPVPPSNVIRGVSTRALPTTVSSMRQFKTEQNDNIANCYIIRLTTVRVPVCRL